LEKYKRNNVNDLQTYIKPLNNDAEFAESSMEYFRGGNYAKICGVFPKRHLCEASCRCGNSSTDSSQTNAKITPLS